MRALAEGRMRRHTSLPLVLLVAAWALSAGGLIIHPSVAFIGAFSLALLVILARKGEVPLGLALLWAVRVEPAPSDLLFLWAWVRRLVRQFRNLKLQMPALLLALFAAFSVLQALWSVSISRGIFFGAATAYLISLAVYFSALSDDLNAWRLGVRCFLTAVLVTSVAVVVLFIMWLVGPPERWLDMYFDVRPRAWFKDPNVAGSFVGTGVLFFVARLLDGNRFPVLEAARFLVTLAALILTFSRGALVSVLVGAAVLSAVSVRAGKFLRPMLLFAVFGTITAWAVPRAFETAGKSARFAVVTDYDLCGRFVAWRTGVALAKDHPWGLGPGQFEPYLESELVGALGSDACLATSAHNTFIRVLAENGILGLATFVAAMVSLMGRLARAMQDARNANLRSHFLYGAWLFSSLVGVLVNSLVIDTLHWRHLWILAGFSLAYCRLVRSALLKAPGTVTSAG